MGTWQALSSCQDGSEEAMCRGWGQPTGLKPGTGSDTASSSPPKEGWHEGRCFIFFISLYSNNPVGQSPSKINLILEIMKLRPLEPGGVAPESMLNSACSISGLANLFCKADRKYFRFDGLIQSLLPILILYYKTLKSFLACEAIQNRPAGGSGPWLVTHTSPWDIYLTHTMDDCGLCYACPGSHITTQLCDSSTRLSPPPSRAPRRRPTCADIH